jgi:hypothetical protein
MEYMWTSYEEFRVQKYDKFSNKASVFKKVYIFASLTYKYAKVKKTLRD